MDRLHWKAADEVREAKLILSMRNEEEKSRESTADLHDFVPVGRVKKILVEYDSEKDVFYRYYRIYKPEEYRFKMFGIHKFISEDKGSLFMHGDDWEIFKMNLCKGRCQSMYIRMRDIRWQEYGWYYVIFEFVYFKGTLKTVRCHLSYIGSWNTAGGNYDKSNDEYLEADFFCKNSGEKKEYPAIKKNEEGFRICSSHYKVESLLLDTYYFMRLNCKDTQIRFWMKIESSLPEILMGDENEVFQMITSLLSRAIKSTSRGLVVLEVGGCKKKSDNFLLEIKVKKFDKSTLEPQKAKKIMHYGNRLPGFETFMPRHLIRHMNGDFKAENISRRENIFQVTLMQKIIKDEPLIGSVIAKKKLLVLESDNFVREYISWVLSQVLADFYICDRAEDITLNEKYSCLVVREYVFSQNKEILEKYFRRSQIILLTEQRKESDVSLVKYRQIPLSMMSLNVSKVINCIVEQKEIIPHFHHVVQYRGFYKKRLLVADSCGLDLKMTQAILKSYFFEVDSADNEAEALELLSHNIYSIVLISRKIMTGSKVKQFLESREAYGYENVPFVTIFQTVNELIQNKMLPYRIEDYLVKPVEVSEINRILDKHLKLENANWTQHTKKKRRRNYPENGLSVKLRTACRLMEYDKAEKIIIKMLHYMYPADVTAHLYAMLESCREFEYDELERQVAELVEGCKEQ